MKRVLAIGALLLALTGCGTVANFQRESPSRPTPYGGVEIAVDRFNAHPEIPGALLYSDSAHAIDVALSAVGDTLTLPITASLSAWRATERLWYVAFFYNDFDERQRSNPWREFWFNETSTAAGAHEAEHAAQPVP